MTKVAKEAEALKEFEILEAFHPANIEHSLRWV
jgi:hypothetical protein